jgi:hypothetical protein
MKVDRFPTSRPADDIKTLKSVRRTGRPRGTDYRRVDRPLHEEMRRKLEQCEVPSKMAAARTVADKAYGDGTCDSKITRLVRTYPF